MLVRKLCLPALVAGWCVVAAGCSSNGSPTVPSHTARAGSATIIGHVNGFSSSTSAPHHLDGSSSVGTNGVTFTENASTTLTVTINGTNISSNVDGNGNFELTGVPPGNVTLTFSGAGANASITLNNVPANAQISITVTLNGNSARLENRKDEDDDEDDDHDEGELEGSISNKSGNCPTVTFTVQGTTVTTDGNTKFEGGQCPQIANGRKVEVDGTRQGNNTVLAKNIEFD